MTGDIFELGYQAENTQTPWQWGFDNIRLRDSPYGERFVVEETPWLKEPLETLPEVTIQECVLMCCAQGGKSVTEQVALAWALDQRPGFTMFAAQTGDAAKFVAKQKIIPIIEAVPSLAAQMPQGKNRHKKSLREILFANATLLIGPANESFFRGHTVQWFFGDECSMWDPGKIDQGRARTTRVWNRKIFLASTPLEINSDFTKAYDAGDQRKYHLGMPCCGELVYLTSDNIEKLFSWGGSDPAACKTADGKWDFLKLRPSIRLVCPKCGARHQQRIPLKKDDPLPAAGADVHASTRDMSPDEIWRKMIAGARYVVMNPGAPPEKVSFAFNVLCLPPSVFPWHMIVEQYLSAREEEQKGNLAPLKEFITLRLAEGWNEKKFFFYTLPDFQDYNPSEEWPDELFRCLTVDCQEHLAEFWAVVRAWGKDGSSRLLAFAKLRTEAEIQDLQEQWKVKPHLVALDCAYQTYQVFEMCTRHGWCAMRGEDRTDYLHTLPDGQKVRRPYSPPVKGDPRSGKSYQGRSFCWVFNWSNPTIKDITWNLKEGKGAPWAVCDLGAEMGEIYAKGVDSERKREEIDRFNRTVLRWKKIRANHPWDAECESTVFACMAKLFLFGGDTGKKDGLGQATSTMSNEQLAMSN